jgi:hypothetical protein
MELGPAFTQQDLAYQDNPALRPEVIRARVKQVYEKTLIGRTLLPVEQVNSDAVSWLEEGNIVGNVDWISEKGGFPELDTSYEKKSKPIRPYGAYFDVTLLERHLSRIQTVSRKINRAVYAMRRFEDDLIFNRILNATGVNTFDGSNWTDTNNGDPVGDLEKAKRLISDATEGQEATDVIMSSLMYERLTKFDVVRNNNYLQAAVVRTGVIPGLAGLNIIRDNAVDPNDDGQIVVLRRGAFGFIGETIPLTTVSVSGNTLGNPMLDARHYNFAMAEPVIDAAEFITIVTGLKA